MNPELIAEYDSLRDLSSKPFRSACYAPFVSLVFDSIGRVRACCVNFEYILGDIRKERIDEIWNGERIEKMRAALRDYQFHFGCELCYRKLESGGFKSGRLIDSGMMAYKFDPFEVDQGPTYWPRHLEFHLSNRCNLECVGCTGEYSSMIRKYREKRPPVEPAYGDQFFEDLEKYFDRLQAAHFLGGEPFLILEMHRIWDRLIERKLTPFCHITTNGTVYNAKVERIISELPIGLSVSCDGATRETFEKIRVRARFDLVMRNFRRLRDLMAVRHPQRGVSVNFTLSRLNWHELVDMFLFAEDEGAWLNVIDLRWPDDLSIFTLPKSDLGEIVETLERQASSVESRLKRQHRTLRNKLTEIRWRHERLQSTPSASPLAVLNQADVDASCQESAPFAAAAEPA